MKKRALHVAITAYVEPNEAVKRIVNVTTIIADPAFLLPRLLTLLQMLNMPPSGTHSDNTTVFTSIRSMVVPMWLQLSLILYHYGQCYTEYYKLPIK